MSLITKLTATTHALSCSKAERSWLLMCAYLYWCGRLRRIQCNQGQVFPILLGLFQITGPNGMWPKSYCHMSNLSYHGQLQDCLGFNLLNFKCVCVCVHFSAVDVHLFVTIGITFLVTKLSIILFLVRKSTWPHRYPSTIYGCYGCLQQCTVQVRAKNRTARTMTIRKRMVVEDNGRERKLVCQLGL